MIISSPVSFTSWLLSLPCFLSSTYWCTFITWHFMFKRCSLHPENPNCMYSSALHCQKGFFFVSEASFNYIIALSPLVLLMLISSIRLSRGQVMIFSSTKTQTCCDDTERIEGWRGRLLLLLWIRLGTVGTVTNQCERSHISPGGRNQRRRLNLTWFYQIQSSHGAKPGGNEDSYLKNPSQILCNI